MAMAAAPAVGANAADASAGQVGFFEDHKGQKSSMRLMSFVSLLAAIFYGGVIVFSAVGRTTNIPDDAMIITIGFLVGAFAPKAVQKFAELNPAKSAQG